MAEEKADYERQLEQSIFTEGQGYAARNVRSKEENKGRAAARDRIKAQGISPQAFGAAVALVKTKSPREIDDYLRDFNAVVKVLRQRQQELFPEEAAAAAKREQKAADLASKTPAGQDAKSDANPRSNPDAGGAKPRTGKPKPSASGKPTLTVAGGTDVKPTDEQAEGDAALNAGMQQTNAASKKESQSAKAARIAAEAGTTH